jgi:hypothetical protein
VPVCFFWSPYGNRRFAEDALQGLIWRAQTSNTGLILCARGGGLIYLSRNISRALSNTRGNRQRHNRLRLATRDRGTRLVRVVTYGRSPALRTGLWTNATATDAVLTRSRRRLLTRVALPPMTVPASV